MLVSGVLSGSPCLYQAFFTERYVQEHPEAHEQIEKLKDLIAWQVNVHQQPHRAGGGGGERGVHARATWAASAPVPVDISQSARSHACRHINLHTSPPTALIHSIPGLQP